MVKKYCIFCGSENFSRSKLYCSLECKNKDYYQKNKEKLLESHKEWNKNNTDKNREYQRKWATNNFEKRLEYKREWYRKNKKKETVSNEG